ncbi:ADP-heptose--LPS heptosyltransferase [Paramagnetospirillum marisnigri]|uniref:ADP-heptose--LPS heptosyltransferase n=1 Tax=Paramagnetospirillum marisnigri TaxID=1285242 RepID=A0A178MS58_9PROT|nr:glycosyltransferase family 9 protein [Paramagnetospirillum marisnigri]OAN52210.1 ADP-heptose--LPS heptosyltransferase [Paramagnetospirillum marisnigri]
MSLFPRGMRRRWWMFRPIDALVALWPAPRERKGVLVVRMDGIGDMVMFRAALEHYPDAFGVAKSEITVLGCNSWKPLADQVFPGFKVVAIDEHAFEKKWLYRLKIALMVRRQGFQVAVCDMFMRKTLTADSLVWASRAEQRIVCTPFITERTKAEYAWYLAKATRVIDTGPYPTHEGLRHFTFLQALTGTRMPPEVPAIPWRNEPPALPEGGAYVVMNFGSNEPGRRWPFAQFLDLARHCLEAGLRVVFVGARQEDFAKPAIAALDHPGVVDTIGSLKLPQLVDVLKHAACVVSNDTGPGHLAIGVGAATVLLAGGGHFGCFVPYPESIRPPRAVFLNHEMDCYHCLWRCPKRASDADAFPCVAGISVQRVWEAVRGLVSPS